MDGVQPVGERRRAGLEDDLGGNLVSAAAP